MEIVKVKYLKDGQPSGIDYSYFSEDVLQVGDLVNAPTKNGDLKARVTEIGVTESEIEAFRGAVRTIPAGARVKEGVEPLDLDMEPTEDPELQTQIEKLNAVTHELIAETERLDHPEHTAVIILRPDLDAGFIALRDSLISLKDHAEARVIKSETDLPPAIDDLAIISKCKKSLEEFKDRFLKPIQKHLDAVREPFKELAELLAGAELTNKNKLKIYDDAVKQRAAEIEKINQEAQELARKQAALNGGAFTVDTTPLEAPAPLHHVSTMSGTASFTKAPPTWELEDWDKVPKEYKILDTVRIGRVVRAGGSIPGIKIIQQTGVRVTTRYGEIK